jgi:hypothetical protein
LLPVPSFQNELLKAKRNSQEARKRSENLEEGILDDLTIDLELLSLGETTPEVSKMNGSLTFAFCDVDGRP